MANVNSMFPSKWLRASDLQGGEPILNIERMAMEEVEQGKDQQPVLYFMGKDKGLVLNKTNAMNVSVLHGPETDAWVGKQIQLFTTYVDYQGRSVLAIRIKPAQPSAPATENPAPAEAADPDDSIPF